MGYFLANSKTLVSLCITKTGERWKKLVGLELFSLKKQKCFKYITEEEGDFLVKKISKSTQTQTLIDLRKTFFSFTAGTMFRLALEQNFHECDFIDMDILEELMIEAETNVCMTAFTDFLPTGLGWLVYQISGQHSRMNKAFSNHTNFFQHVVDEHLNIGQSLQENILFLKAKSVGNPLEIAESERFGRRKSKIHRKIVGISNGFSTATFSNVFPKILLFY